MLLKSKDNRALISPLINRTNMKNNKLHKLQPLFSFYITTNCSVVGYNRLNKSVSNLLNSCKIEFKWSKLSIAKLAKIWGAMKGGRGTFKVFNLTYHAHTTFIDKYTLAINSWLLFHLVIRQRFLNLHHLIPVTGPHVFDNEILNKPLN